jgi:3D (Asp-Asp-Asp) domain-containing protein
MKTTKRTWMQWNKIAATVALAVLNPINSSAGEDKDAVRTTAYTHTESDHLEYGRKTAVGTTLKSGGLNSAAADWSVYPVGTKFKIAGNDTVYEIDDYGSALVGTETIDIYRPSRSSMNAWGVKYVDIEIVEEGCIETSIEILRQRTRYAHCRAMLARLLEQAQA